MKKSVRIIIVVAASLAVLAVAARYFAEWSVERAFQSAAEGGREMGDSIEAALGSALARGDPPSQPGEARPEGIMLFYHKHPQALERDKKDFETWYHAMAITDAFKKEEHQQRQWISSASENWMVPSHKTDAWGHAFCVQSDKEQTIVVSAGPQARNSLDCNALSISQEELARMPQCKLNADHSGALILWVKKTPLSSAGSQ